MRDHTCFTRYFGRLGRLRVLGVSRFWSARSFRHDENLDPKCHVADLGRSSGIYQLLPQSSGASQKVNIIHLVHEHQILARRLRVLSGHFASLLPENASVLDVGCGSGQIDALVAEKRPDISLRGIDVLVRKDTAVPVDYYDGTTIPFPDKSFDVVAFLDVLHHTKNVEGLLKESARVTRSHVILKDHICENSFDMQTLRFMDRVGNCRFGVGLEFNYYSRRQWDSAFESSRLRVGRWNQKLGLYPFPLALLFERKLHFVCRLDIME